MKDNVNQVKLGEGEIFLSVKQSPLLKYQESLADGSRTRNAPGYMIAMRCNWCKILSRKYLLFYVDRIKAIKDFRLPNLGYMKLVCSPPRRYSCSIWGWYSNICSLKKKKNQNQNKTIIIIILTIFQMENNHSRSYLSIYHLSNIIFRQFPPLKLKLEFRNGLSGWFTIHICQPMKVRIS